MQVSFQFPRLSSSCTSFSFVLASYMLEIVNDYVPCQSSSVVDLSRWRVGMELRRLSLARHGLFLVITRVLVEADVQYTLPRFPGMPDVRRLGPQEKGSPSCFPSSLAQLSSCKQCRLCADNMLAAYTCCSLFVDTFAAIVVDVISNGPCKARAVFAGLSSCQGTMCSFTSSFSPSLCHFSNAIRSWQWTHWQVRLCKAWARHEAEVIATAGHRVSGRLSGSCQVCHLLFLKV